MHLAGKELLWDKRRQKKACEEKNMPVAEQRAKHGGCLSRQRRGAGIGKHHQLKWCRGLAFAQFMRIDPCSVASTGLSGAEAILTLSRE